MPSAKRCFLTLQIFPLHLHQQTVSVLQFSSPTPTSGMARDLNPETPQSTLSPVTAASTSVPSAVRSLPYPRHTTPAALPPRSPTASPPASLQLGSTRVQSSPTPSPAR